MNGQEILTQSIQQNIFKVRKEEDTFLFTLSDLHIGMGNLDYIKQIVKFIEGLDNALLVIGGDLIDNPTRTSKGSVIECYATPQEQIQLAVQTLKPIKDKIVAILVIMKIEP